MKINLANLAQATEQQVLDQVAGHLLAQNARSMSKGSSRCVYRGEGGLMCAAGCLIDDSEYDPMMDVGINGWSPNGLLQRFDITGTHALFIGSLQQIHDTVDPQLWHAELTRVAMSRNLEWKF